MSHVSTYLNFKGTTEAAFEFYKSVFGTDYLGPVMRHGDVPLPEGVPPVPDDVKNLIMNIQLPILAGHLLMGTDIYDGMGMSLTSGNNFSIVLHPDTREDVDSLYRKLLPGGKPGMEPQDAFWGGYYADLTDQFGIQWSINYDAKS